MMVHRTLARSNNSDFNFTLSKVENVDSANEDNRVNDSYGSDSEVEERGGVIEQDDSFGVSDSEGGDSIVDKRNFHGGSHVPLIIASLECLELLLELTKRSTIAHDRGKVYFLTNTRHNKMYCKKHPFSKSPKNRPGRPHKEVIPHVSAGLFIHAPEGTLGRKWFASASQPEHDVPNLSSGLPKRGPGRPRKKLSEGVYIISFCSIIVNV
ncbi:hypothetical protein HID58_018799 [Brassica napus]|uniref:Uncharacterized protein n=1 Tax=Brassica napus TaxID=3708 RepID=A0ABQ8DCM5_BRANA|nr:hypothetical protein HID58_018799 [Brassica napus]